MSSHDEIAAQTAAFLARGGTITHPVSQPLRAGLSPNTKDGNRKTTTRVWIGAVPNLSSVKQRKKKPPARIV